MARQDHEPFGIRVHPEISPARIDLRLHENQVLRFPALINANLGKTPRDATGSSFRGPPGKEKCLRAFRYPVL